MSPNHEHHANEVVPGVLAQRNAHFRAMDESLEWAGAEWGEPSDADEAQAAQIWANR